MMEIRIFESISERKSKMMRLRQLSHRARLCVILLVGGLALSCVAQAVVSVGIVPNAATFNYALAGGAVSGPVTLPVTERPVLLMGVNKEPVPNRGVGHVSIARIAAAPAVLVWTGVHAPPAAFAQGNSAVAGTDILFLDAPRQVVVEVNDASSVRVLNTAGAAKSGNLLLVY